MKHFTLLSGSTPSAQEQRILKFAAWMGVPTKTYAADDVGLPGLFSAESPHSQRCIAMSDETLASLLESSSQPAAALRFLDENCAQLLVFCCDDVRNSGNHGSGRGAAENSSPQDRAIASLTSGAVRNVVVTEKAEDIVDFPQSGAMFSRQFAGLSFSATRETLTQSFALGASSSVIEPIMRVNGQPMFLQLKRASCEIFLLAGSALPDVSEPLTPRSGIEDFFPQVIPLLLFLNHCFGKSCWHGPEPTARILIDDPLLTDKYGFLDYKALLESMVAAHYATSIAFIPWNYKRTSAQAASPLVAARENFSLCIHGCDHTNREFATDDEAILVGKSALALVRMEQHRQRTAVPFDPVMIFPQGLFSTAAIAALRDNNYLAAINTSCFPIDDNGAPLTLGDFLRPAITRFGGFPIFQRRYPRRLIDFAFDIFMGRPVFVVEHHEFFRDGCGKLEAFVAELQKLDPRLSWPSLTSQLERSCWMRYISDDSIEIQFFTRTFQLRNVDPAARRFLLARQEPDSSIIQSVSVDGSPVAFRFEGGFLRLEVQCNPGQTRKIEIVDRPRRAIPVGRAPMAYNLNVALRRGLSEFRDNTLARHPGALRIARRLMHGLKVTGGGGGTAATQDSATGKGSLARKAT
jgi:hypothetical protein